jgi:hypothetical protein
MKFGRLTFALAMAPLLAGFAAQPAFSSQGHSAPGPMHPAAIQEGKPGASSSAPKQNSSDANKDYGGRGNTGAAKPQGDGRGLAGLPSKWVDNLRDMSPQEQERFMRNNRRFQNLPPQRQAQIRRNLEKWNNLSPTERNAIRDRERRWEQMSPEQRQYVKNTLLPKWEAMPAERRTLLTGRLHVLQGMTTTQQEEALKNPRFMQGLSPDEQQLLRDVNSLRNPPLP